MAASQVLSWAIDTAGTGAIVHRCRSSELRGDNRRPVQAGNKKVDGERRLQKEYDQNRHRDLFDDVFVKLCSLTCERRGIDAMPKLPKGETSKARVEQLFTLLGFQVAWESKRTWQSGGPSAVVTWSTDPLVDYERLSAGQDTLTAFDKLPAPRSAKLVPWIKQFSLCICKHGNNLGHYLGGAHDVAAAVAAANPGPANFLPGTPPQLPTEQLPTAQLPEQTPHEDASAGEWLQGLTDPWDMPSPWEPQAQASQSSSLGGQDVAAAAASPGPADFFLGVPEMPTAQPLEQSPHEDAPSHAWLQGVTDLWDTPNQWEPQDQALQSSFLDGQDVAAAAAAASPGPADFFVGAPPQVPTAPLPEQASHEDASGDAWMNGLADVLDMPHPGTPWEQQGQASQSSSQTTTGDATLGSDQTTSTGESWAELTARQIRILDEGFCDLFGNPASCQATVASSSTETSPAIVASSSTEPPPAVMASGSTEPLPEVTESGSTEPAPDLDLDAFVYF